MGFRIHHHKSSFWGMFFLYLFFSQPSSKTKQFLRYLAKDRMHPGRIVAVKKAMMMDGSLEFSSPNKNWLDSWGMNVNLRGFKQARWWFQKFYFLSTPIWGRFFKFDVFIFFKWVGEKPPTSKIFICEQECTLCLQDDGQTTFTWLFCRQNSGGELSLLDPTEV